MTAVSAPSITPHSVSLANSWSRNTLMKNVSRSAFLFGLAFAGTAFADAKSEVFAAWDAMLAAKSYSTRMVTTIGEQTHTQVIEVIVPDHARTSGGPMGDLVLTPKGAWLKAPGKDWGPAPEFMVTLTRQMMSPEFISKAKSGVTSAKDLGLQDFSGKPVRAYAIEQTLTIMGIQSHNTTRLLVEANSGRPLRQEIDSIMMGKSSHVVHDITYVPDLKIDAPM